MKTEKFFFDGVKLTIPWGMDLPFDRLADAPNCCGPGDGVAELAIPEHFLGLRISAACYIHDRSWDMCFDSRPEFAQTNQMFLGNLRSIINTRTTTWSWKLPIRHAMAQWYYWTVNSNAGWITFVTRKVKAVRISA